MFVWSSSLNKICGVERMDLIHPTCSDVKGVKGKMVKPWCGIMSQICNYTVVAATLSYFTFLYEINMVTTQLCPYVGFPTVLQNLVYAFCPPSCLRIWVLVCIWTGKGSCWLHCGLCQCAVPSVCQGKLVPILCAELILVSVIVRHFSGSIKLLWLWGGFLQCSASCSSSMSACTYILA